VYPAANAACTFLYRARLALVSLIRFAAAITWFAVAGLVEPYIFMSGRPSVVPMSPMPACAPGAAAAAADNDDMVDAMPAGPSGPAQPGVITAVVAAITAAGKAARLGMRAKPVRRRTGRASSEGRHSSAAQPAIRATSRITLTRSSAPKDSGWPLSGPNGNPARREAK